VRQQEEKGETKTKKGIPKGKEEMREKGCQKGRANTEEINRKATNK